MKKTLIATAMSLAISQTALAADDYSTDYSQEDKASTYWGLGIGTALGALLGGPPGAAAGAALGGSIGWGTDKHQALDEAEQELGVSALELADAEDQIAQLQSENRVIERENREMQRINALQSAELSDLMAIAQKERAHDEVLASIAQHYTQEIYYRHNESSVPDYAKAGIAELADFMLENSGLSIALRGHADLIGTEEANMALSQARVDAIHDYLVGKGIAPQRIKREALGESHATVTAGDAKNYVLDRRVAIELSVPRLQEQPVAVAGESL